MADFERYKSIIKQKHPSYLFSWETLTDLILEQVTRKPFWLDIGAGPNVLIKEQPGADFAVGLDIEKPDTCYTDLKSAYCVASTYHIPFANGTFDFITSRYTFEHLKYPAKAFIEISRVLKPGGTFIIQTTNKNGPFLLLARLIPYRIKKLILKKLFDANPSDIFKTYYKTNTPAALESLCKNSKSSSDLHLEKLIMAEDIFCHSKLLFTISMQMYKLLKWFNDGGLMGNMIAVYEKEN